MAITAKAYGRAALSLGNGEIDFDSHTFKLMLTTSAYTPDQDAHRYKSDVTNEVAGTGYTAGGATLASVAVTYTGATNVMAVDWGDVTFGPPASFTFRNAVLYDATPATDATRPLIGYISSDVDIVVTSTLTVTFAAGGVVTITAS